MILLGAVIVKAYYFFFWIIFWEGKLSIESRESFLKCEDVYWNMLHQFDKVKMQDVGK